MIKRRLPYYFRTIVLKSKAAAYGVLDAWRLLHFTKNKEQKQIEALYHRYEVANIGFSATFSTRYSTYNYFPTQEDCAAYLAFDTQKIAYCRADTKPAWYNPLNTAQYALVCYNDLLNGDNPPSESIFWTQINYLKKIGVQKESGFYFYYTQLFPKFKVKPPYYTGITQAIIASAFLRAYQLSQDKSWLHLAHETLKPILIPIEQGGILGVTPEGLPWVEEYPNPDDRTLVLNGFIFVLIGLGEFLYWGGEEETLNKAFSSLTKSLFYSWHHYQRGANLRYSRFYPTFQNIEYKGLTVCFFIHLLDLTQNKAFEHFLHRANKNVSWKAFFDFYDMEIPVFFKQLK